MVELEELIRSKRTEIAEAIKNKDWALKDRLISEFAKLLIQRNEMEKLKGV